jgi:UDP-N-acetylglucosamine 4,6-dehydratase/5-epimerase
MRVCVTGGTGSLGRALLRRLVNDGAERIVTFSRDQHRRDALAREFGSYPGITDRIYWHDLSDVDRLTRTFTGCEVVVHAAAAKVVGAHPDEPEGLQRTNVDGTRNVLVAAERAGVRKVLVISSDKAVQPTNAYGMSKAAAEQLAVTANAHSWPKGCRVSALRYGNVLSSNGSVVVHWRAATAARQPLKISDARMTRFWVTLEQAVEFVMRAVEMMRGGEIFVPHIPAAPILTLAEAIKGGDGWAYEVTGIRPGGEKLHESMLSEDEVRRALRWRGFYVVPPALRTWDGTPWPGEPAPADLLYRSDVWGWQLSVSDMRALLGEPEAAAMTITIHGPDEKPNPQAVLQ